VPRKTSVTVEDLLIIIILDLHDLIQLPFLRRPKALEQKECWDQNEAGKDNVFSDRRFLHHCVIKEIKRNQMIPLRDENPSKAIPIVNTCLILANVSVFLYAFFFVPRGAEPLPLRLGFIPYEITNAVDLSPKNLVPVPLTIVTAMFIHGGWLHLLSNMLYLWIFGDNVEDKLGHFKYLLFYLMCGVMASLTHGFLNLTSQVPTIGASGAIAGVLGAYMVLYPTARIRTLLILFVFVQVVSIPAIVLLGYWILIQVLSGITEFGSPTKGGIAWFAHVGGFVTGLVLITMTKKRKGRAYQR
jgi:membrane associated rhomboid family serine protease